MKKTLSSRNEKKTRSKKGQNSGVDIEDAKILRTVKDQEAFYFYEAVGKPIGQIARNLHDFLEKVKSVRLESLTFHLQRRDFQTWIEKVLGDSKLAGKIEKISCSSGDDIRTNICTTVENRIKELAESLVQIYVEDKPIVLASSV
jgi:hypothetical protein